MEHIYWLTLGKFLLLATVLLADGRNINDFEFKFVESGSKWAAVLDFEKAVAV